MLNPCPAPGPDRRAAKEDDVLSLFQGAAGFQAAQTSGMKTGVKDAEGTKLLRQILASLEDDKALDVVTIPLAGKSEMADFMVVCSGRSSRQVSAISEKLVERLKADYGLSAKVEGKEAGDWVLIDTGDVVVHVFRPEVREFYQLEKMWLTPALQTAQV